MTFASEYSDDVERGGKARETDRKRGGEEKKDKDQVRRSCNWHFMRIVLVE